jgi:hypothetical protein
LLQDLILFQRYLLQVLQLGLALQLVFLVQEFLRLPLVQSVLFQELVLLVLELQVLLLQEHLLAFLLARIKLFQSSYEYIL